MSKWTLFIVQWQQSFLLCVAAAFNDLFEYVWNGGHQQIKIYRFAYILTIGFLLKWMRENERANEVKKNDRSKRYVTWFDRQLLKFKQNGNIRHNIRRRHIFSLFICITLMLFAWVFFQCWIFNVRVSFDRETGKFGRLMPKETQNEFTD